MTGSSYKPEKKNPIIHHEPVAQQIKMYAKTHLKTHCKNPQISRNALVRQPPLFGRDQESVAIATNSQTSTPYSFIQKERPPVLLGKKTGPVKAMGGKTYGLAISAPREARSCVKRFTPDDPGEGIGVK